MPLQLKDDAPTTFPSEEYLTLDTFKNGVITLIDKSRLPKNALEEAENIFLYEDGSPGPRPGVDWYGAVSPNGQAIDGFDYFDYAGVIHLVMVAGGTVYRSTNDGTTWTACTGATLTAGSTVNMVQYNSYLYLTNGVDNITLYNGTTVLTTYGALATPSAPTHVVSASNIGTNYTRYYKISAVNTIGYSIASAKLTVQTKYDRSAWDNTTNFVTFTMPASVANQTRFDIFTSEDDLNYYYLSSVTTPTAAFIATYVDNGQDIVVPSTLAPTANTTQGPKVEELSIIGSRLYGVRDTVNKYRIWYSSGQPPYGAFASGNDGGYLEWQPGGKYFPVVARDYRDGKGTPLATIWCKSADGQGSILQMTLDVVTVGDISVTVPSAYQLPGSRGTPAPGSVVNVLNDYYFYNTQAFYNLGSRAQFLNLLSTDESSANIRPTVKAISTTGESKITAVYFDAKVYFSVPYGSTTNNATIIYDTERKAWLPKAFTIGFKKFLRYTDTAGGNRLLCIKPGDTRLSQISTSISGDYGTAFATSLVTGLYSVRKNRFDFQWTEEGQIELSNPQGEINIELLGIERTRGYRTTNTETVQTTSTNTGWGTLPFGAHFFGDTTVVPETFSESSVKRYFNVQKELNAVQWRITTNSLNARYILRTLQSWGTPTEGGLPRQWRIS